MKLTIWNRIKICWEVLTITSGHPHPTQEKQLSIFQYGYSCGVQDGRTIEDYCIPENKKYKPFCFGDVYKSFHDCEPCPVYESCEMEALVKEL